MKQFLKAFILSNLFNLVGTALFAVLIGVGFAIPHLAELGGDKNAYYNYVQAHKGIYWVIEAIGMLVSIASGYLAAWIARDKFLLAGALSATVCVLEGIFSLFTTEISVWGVLALFLNVLLGVLGSYIYLRTKVIQRV